MLEKLKEFLETDFEKDLLEEAINNLNNKSKIRHCNFAYATRSLIDYIFEKRLSPNEKVINATWYSQEKEDIKVTRNQRYKYFIQGEIDDYFINEIINFENVDEIVRNFNKNVYKLSKYTHIKPEIFYSSENEISAFICEIENSIDEILEEITHIKNKLLDRLNIWLFNTVNEEFVSQTIQEIDELCTHYEIEYVDIEDLEILNSNNKSLFLDIGEPFIIKITGNINVEHQYGSDGDYRRGDGLRYNASYPYEMTIKVEIPKIKEIIDDDEEYLKISNYTEEKKNILNKTFFNEFYENIEVLNQEIDTSAHYL